MPLAEAYPFGLRDVKITPITNNQTEALGTPLDLPAGRHFTFTEAEDFDTLRGDDRNVTSRGKGASVNWDLEGGGVSFDILKAIVGGTLTDTGTTPAQSRKLRKKVTDARPFFKVEGQAMDDGTGDVHGIVYRCKATGDVEYNFSDGEWFLTTCSGEGFPSRAAASLDALYDIIFNETAVAIPLV